MNKIVYLFVITLSGIYISSVNAKEINRLYNGSPATENQFPYMISLQKLSQVLTYTRGHRCGGVLVTLQYALTAASCTFDSLNGVSVPIDPDEYRVFAGSVRLISDTPPADRIRSITNITVHNGYFVSNPAVNDIAIILLVSPFSATTATAVQLSTTDPSSSAQNACTVAGWGAQNGTAVASTQLTYSQLTVREQSDCRVFYANLPVTFDISDGMICAWAATHSGCTGDIGNPLVCNSHLTGILVRSNNCVPSANPEVYTRVSNYRAWINEVTRVGNAASTFQPGLTVLSTFAVLRILMSKVLS